MQVGPYGSVYLVSVPFSRGFRPLYPVVMVAEIPGDSLSGVRLASPARGQFHHWSDTLLSSTTFHSTTATTHVTRVIITDAIPNTRTDRPVITYRHTDRANKFGPADTTSRGCQN